jgi:addiction module HigA family antidote
MNMHNPAHPGEILKELYLEPLGLSISEVAKGLGVSRKSLSELVNGHYGLSIEMAIRLSKAFNSSAESWLNMQQQYDLWKNKDCNEKFIVKEFIPYQQSTDTNG